MPDRRRPPRFIAGAVCPACGEMDRIVIERDEASAERRRCVSCGHADGEVPGASPPPGTRFSRAPGQRAEPQRNVATTTVKILPRKPPPGGPDEPDKGG